MTDRAARNQENSLAAFLAKKAEFDALLAELTQASADHFGADPETVLWGDPRIAPTKGVDGWNRTQPVQGPTPVDALVDGRKLRRGLRAHPGSSDSR